MTDFITALGLVFILEGVAYALFPEAMKRTVASIMALPPSVLRAVGLGAAVFGLTIVWLGRG